MEVAVSAREHLNKAVFVTLRDDGNGRAVKIDPVLLMQWSAANAKFYHGLGSGAWRNLDDIDIRRGPL